MSAVNLVGLLPEDLEPFCRQWGEPAFRSRQISDWVYRKKVGSCQEMTNLSSRFRTELSYRYAPGRSSIALERVSRDGSRKYLIELSDGQSIETVVIPARRRRTLCVSTQVGCPVRCSFCATGLSGFVRDLDPSEIVEQIWLVEKKTGQRITHLVFMGMGEPLLNYESLSRALRVIVSPDGIALGSRHITISTIGIPETMLRLGQEWNQVSLALSLHAASDHLRNTLVPMNRIYPVSSVLKALKEHGQITNRRATIEYCLWQDINDRPAHARQLAERLSDSHVHVNLIAGNRVGGSPFHPSSMNRVRMFARVLEERKILVTIRETRGADIQAACGELRGSSQTGSDRNQQSRSGRKPVKSSERKRTHSTPVRRRQRTSHKENQRSSK